MSDRLNAQRLALMAAFMSTLATSSTAALTSRLSPTRKEHGHPWDRVHLTKAERRGKTYEEMQAMRRERWERSVVAVERELG
jgi:hypothetical protein